MGDFRGCVGQVQLGVPDEFWNVMDEHCETPWIKLLLVRCSNFQNTI